MMKTNSIVVSGIGVGEEKNKEATDLGLSLWPG